MSGGGGVEWGSLDLKLAVGSDFCSSSTDTSPYASTITT